MKLTIQYSADADTIGALIGNMPDDELRRVKDVRDTFPELFPKMTRTLIDFESEIRGGRS